jgi:hypothetical protein
MCVSIQRLLILTVCKVKPVCGSGPEYSAKQPEYSVILPVIVNIGCCAVCYAITACIGMCFVPAAVKEVKYVLSKLSLWHKKGKVRGAALRIVASRR